jgi:hypothetical protein
MQILVGFYENDNTVFECRAFVDPLPPLNGVQARLIRDGIHQWLVSSCPIHATTPPSHTESKSF